MSSLPVERAFGLEPERPAPGSLARPLVSGRLELEFAADADARTYLRRQYASYPFHVCRAQFQDRDLPGLPTLYIQSCAGGVYEDDRLELALAMREKAEAHVSTQSATIVHSMPKGTATQGMRIHCDRGAYLEFLPDPQILFPGSRYQSITRIRLGEAATCFCLQCQGHHHELEIRNANPISGFLQGIDHRYAELYLFRGATYFISHWIGDFTPG